MLSCLRSNLLDDADRLVAEDVARPEERPAEDAVQVQVRAADRRRGDAYDRVRGLLDTRVSDVIDTNVLPAVPDDRFHGSLVWPIPVSTSRTRMGPPVFGESGGVSAPAPSLMPTSSSRRASSAPIVGFQPSCLRARDVSIRGTSRARSSHPEGVGWR